MRLILAALAALLLASSANAKVALISGPAARPSTDEDGEEAFAPNARLKIVTDIFDRFARAQGIPSESLYIVVPSGHTAFAEYKFGRFPVGPGRTDSVTVDAVVHVGAFRPTNITMFANRWRPTSLTRADSLPYVPTLLLLDSGPMDASLGVGDWRDATVCSLGVKNIAGNGWISSGETPSGTHEGERSQYQVGYPEIWFNTDYTGFTVPAATAPAGGLRVLIGTGGNSNFLQTEIYGVLSQPDSCSRASDSMAVWTRLNSHASNAKQLVCAFAFNTGYANYSAGGEDVPNIADDVVPSIPNIMFSLAYLDSLTGNRVFGKGTIDMGLAVTHWLTNSTRRNPGGYCAEDSTNVYASLDSLAVLGEKITFAANTDSASFVDRHARDVIKLLAVPKAKFCPMYTTGITDTTRVSGGIASSRVANFTRPIDPFGRYRKRGQGGSAAPAYGPWPPTGAAGDSSVSSLVRGALDQTRSTFGANRTCSVIWPAGEDWSPINYEKSDSVLIAAGLAGAKGIVFDPRERLGGDGPGSANPRGYYNEAGRVLPNAAKLIPRIGYNTLANRWFDAAADSAFPPDTLALAGSLALDISRRAWWSAFGPRYDRGIANQRDISDNGKLDGPGFWSAQRSRGVILGVSAQELSGPTTKEYALQPTGPYRVGWLGIKHFVHAVRVMNRLAGRSLVRFVYLDEL